MCTGSAPAVSVGNRSGLRLANIFGRISDPPSESVRTRVFEQLLDKVNPAYYLSVDPRGFNMECFLRTLCG